MATLPLKIILQQYEKAKKKRGQWHESPSGYWTYMMPDGSFLLSHFGTIIFDYNPNTRTYAVGGSTNSDRDAVNSMLMILGLNDKASNAGGDMTLKNDRKQNSFNVRPKPSSRSKRRPASGKPIHKVSKQVKPVSFTVTTHPDGVRIRADSDIQTPQGMTDTWDVPGEMEEDFWNMLARYDEKNGTDLWDRMTPYNTDFDGGSSKQLLFPKRSDSKKGARR